MIDDDDEDDRTQDLVPEDGDPDFFCDAPKKIGRVLTRYTSLATHVEPRSFVARFIPPTLISGGIIAVLLIATVLAQIFARNPFPALALAIGLPLLIFIVLFLVFSIAFERSGFGHACGYVGADGCAFYSCAGSRDHLEVEHVFRFKDAAHLRVRTTHVFFNNRYSHTNFYYVWTDADGVTLMEVGGSHESHDELPPITSSYHFAKQAENVWSAHLLKIVLAKLKEGGSYTFPLAADDYIRLRRDSLRLHLQGKIQEFSSDEITEMRIEQGHVSLKEPGARAGWFTESGIHRFEFGDIANAHVFILLMNKGFGIPITS